MTPQWRCCGQEWTEATAQVIQEGVHRVARCPVCQRWFTNLPGPASSATMGFGKYKGALVCELWTQDAPYCEWLLTIAKPRLKQVLEETRP